MPGFGIGDIIRFNYSQGTQVHDQFPMVLVLHDNWLCRTPRGLTGIKSLAPNDNSKRCLHGLNWNNLSQKEINYLMAVMNPMLEMKLAAKDKDFEAEMAKVHTLRDLDIQSPEDFYRRLIRPFIKPKDWEPYRRYRLDKMRGVAVKMSKDLLSGAKQDTIFRRIGRRLQAMRGPR
jgi:hypothetical protein